MEKGEHCTSVGGVWGGGKGRSGDLLLPCLLAGGMLTGIWLFIYDTGIRSFFHDTDTGICQFAWLMVVWWLDGELGLIGKVRYHIKQLRIKLDRKHS